jgi:hypothetical protein
MWKDTKTKKCSNKKNKMKIMRDKQGIIYFVEIACLRKNMERP